MGLTLAGFTFEMSPGPRVSKFGLRIRIRKSMEDFKQRAKRDQTLIPALGVPRQEGHWNRQSVKCWTIWAAFPDSRTEEPGRRTKQAAQIPRRVIYAVPQ